MSFSFNTSILNNEEVNRQGKDRFLSCLQKVLCKYAYIRIPKTGSASLNRSLFNATNEAVLARNSEPHLRNALFQSPPDWWDHWSAKWCKEITGEQVWEDIFSFTVVRNPYARLYSIWNYEEPMKQKYSFEAWVLEGCPSPWHSAIAGEAFPDNPVLSQNSWICDGEENLVDFVFRLEDINTVGVDVLGGLLGRDRFYIHQHRMNKTAEHDEYKKQYTAEMIDLVKELCANDLSEFRYSFDGTTQDNWFYLNEG